MTTEPDVRRLSAALGAEVRGIDLRHPDDSEVATVRSLLLQHQVLFFPGQEVSGADHVALGRKFGALEVHPTLPSPPGGPDEVVELRASFGGTADEWHTDVTFLPEPSIISIMHMVQCPEVGGDTMWANQYQAYEELSAPMRSLVDMLTAIHDATPHGKPEMKARHPVVRIHPETGRRALMVNEHFTRRVVEMSQAESDVLLAYLVRWSVQERFTVRYRWTAGTIAMWDNRCTQHFVINDFQGERIIQRVTVLGDPPIGGAGRWEPYRPLTVGTASRQDARMLLDLQAIEVAP